MQDSKMHAVPIFEVMSKPKVLVDYFVRLSPDKYIQVGRAGAPLALESFDFYQSKGVAVVYISIADYEVYLNRAGHLANQDEALATEQELIRIPHFVDRLIQAEIAVREMGFAEEKLAQAKLTLHSSLLFVYRHSEIGKIFCQFLESGDEDFYHAVMVALVSVIVASTQEGITPKKLEQTALGALFHDIGKMKLPKSILLKSRAKLDNDDKIVFQGHPEVGSQLLMQTRLFDEEVLKIVAEHHEYANGSGYPRLMKRNEMGELSLAVAFTNAFLDELKERQVPNIQHRVLEVARDFERVRSTQFSKELAEGLLNLLGGERMRAAG